MSRSSAVLNVRRTQAVGVIRLLDGLPVRIKTLAGELNRTVVLRGPFGNELVRAIVELAPEFGMTGSAPRFDPPEQGGKIDYKHRGTVVWRLDDEQIVHFEVQNAIRQQAFENLASSPAKHRYMIYFGQLSDKAAESTIRHGLEGRITLCHLDNVRVERDRSHGSSHCGTPTEE